MERLLVFELRKIGDAILSLPFIAGAISRYDVFVCCHPSSAVVFESVLPPDRIVRWVPPWIGATTDGARFTEWGRGLRLIRQICPDVAICGWADARVEWLMRLSGASARIGFPMTPVNYYAWRVPWRRRHLKHGRWLSTLGTVLSGQRLLTTRLSRREEFQPHVEDWRQVADSTGVSLQLSTPWLKADEVSNQELADWLNVEGKRGNPVWAVHPGAGAEVKKWGLMNFEHVARDFFAANQIPYVVINPPGDQPMVSSGAHSMAFTPLSFKELIALTARVDAVLCNDSAMSHLAAAMGKQVVAVFGPSDPGSFAPFGNAANVVARSVCPHRPCMDRCLMPSVICMEAVGTPDVINRVSEVHKQLVAVPGRAT